MGKIEPATDCDHAIVACVDCGLEGGIVDGAWLQATQAVEAQVRELREALRLARDWVEAAPAPKTLAKIDQALANTEPKPHYATCPDNGAACKGRPLCVCWCHFANTEPKP